MVGQMHDDPVEAVRDRRAGRAAGGVVGPEHEVVDEQLRTAPEETGQRGAPLVGLEAVVLVDPDPRQFLPPPRHLVAAPRELLLRLEQVEPRREPLFMRSGCMFHSPHSPPSWMLRRAAVPSRDIIVPGTGRVGVTSVAGFPWIS